METEIMKGSVSERNKCEGSLELLNDFSPNDKNKHPVEDVKKKKTFINISLLPIKLHYFLAYGALSGVIPYLPVVIKALGINATALGIMYTTLRFTVLFAKPAIGAITDNFKNIRCMIITLVLLSAISYCFLLLIPPIAFNENETMFHCGDNRTALPLPIAYNASCMELDHAQIMCKTEANIFAQDENQIANIEDMSGVTWDFNKSVTYLNFSFNTQKNNATLLLRESTPILRFVSQDVSYEGTQTFCGKLINHSATFTCFPSSDGCFYLFQEHSIFHIYSTYQFWIVMLLVISGGTCFTSMFSLTDAACYEILGEKSQDFGKQRLWATIACGLIALLTGYINDLNSSGSSSQNYTPGFLIMAILTVLDIILLYARMNVKLPDISLNIFKDVRRLFTSWDVIMFSVGVFIIGAFNGLLWTYEFWFLQSLGANQVLLGLTIFVQCVIAEVPFFFFSGLIIQKLGHPLCLIVTFVTYSTRFFLYSVLVNPWYVLPIDVLHGWTFGVFYAAVTSFAKHNAPQGTEATMQGVLGGICEGLGVGVGSLLGGFGWDKIGSHNTFFGAAVISFACILIFSFNMYIAKRKQMLNTPEHGVKVECVTEESNI